MIFISKLQEDTLLLVDKCINENMEHDKIMNVLIENGYQLIKECKNGYIPKTKTKIYKQINDKLEYSFVELIKKRNGMADWETWRLS